MSERRLVLVVGVGRSGTSLLAGTLRELGLHIPQPEVAANASNPRGFGESRWVVDFHARQLRRRRVTVNDARPGAWALMAGAAEDAAVRRELIDWLAPQLAEHGTLVIKDPRTSWLLPLWTRCAAELDARADYVTMLRHPAETLTSARTSYGSRQTLASRAAAWMNVALETERATRGTHRAFIRYDDLLTDWRHELARVSAQLELPAPADPARAAAVDAYVDPGLHRQHTRWDDLDEPVPRRARQLAEDVWSRLQPLAVADGDGPAAHLALDAAHAAYGELYAEAEALAQSSIEAARRGKGAGKPKAPAPPPSLRVRVARRIPVRHRTRLRALFGKGRGGAGSRARP